MKKILHKLYLTALFISIAGAVISFMCLMIICTHDHVVTSNDFLRVEKDYPEIKGDIIPVNRFFEEFNSSAIRAESAGKLSSYKISWNEYSNRYESDRAWDDGKQHTNFIHRSELSLMALLLSVFASFIIFITRIWLIWLLNPKQ